MSWERLRFFVVDDDDIALQAQCALLRAAGHEVVGHVDAASALPDLMRYVPDAIVIDVVMGGLDGLEFCRQVRHRPELARTAIVGVTQLSDLEYWRCRLAEVGAVGLIAKPLDKRGVGEVERMVRATRT
jgi:CheY-like chemotaxis protein